ncbi:MAG: transcriptional repressor general negative regulator of transcription subunit 4 [Claussenomyces sp. TS43310]|nr:MAG: transcriptional repressor general negative regulator of transcription subunit 4 [Claussenomyces sp. TS43310]
MASSSRGVQQDSFIDEDDLTCPLCVEEFDLSDRNFRPCPCGYQVCQFCFNNIKNNMNGLCPACRRPYDEKTMEFKIVTPEEIAQFKANAQKNAKKKAAERQKEAQKREVESLNRKHLAGLRVVQKNLVYVVGLSPGIPEQDLLKTLRGDKYFGQYGNIIKIVVSKAKAGDATANGSSIGVYVTFARKEDAARCIAAVNGSQNGDRVLRAQLGTTKYCSAYLRNETCTNKQCMFLHEPGDNDDSYSRQDLSSINSVSTQRPLPVNNVTNASSNRHAAQTQAPIQQSQPIAAASQIMGREPSKDGSDSGDGSALPSSASWANRGAHAMSRSGSFATSGATSSPAISNAMPTTAETDLQEEQTEQAPEDTAPSRSTPSKPPANALLMTLIKSINSLTTCSATRLGTDAENDIVRAFPALFDDEGGLKRRAMREQQEEARLSVEHDSNDVASIVEPQEEEQPESGSLQLGGEPEDREDGRSVGNQSQGFLEQRRPSAQLPIQRSTDVQYGGSLGQGFPQNVANSSVNGRALTPSQQQQLLLFKSGQPQSSFLDQFPQGMGGAPQSSLFQQQGHNRQSSRYIFGNDTTSLKSNPNTKVQQASMMSQQGNQFYGPSIPGPPPGLKSSGTPPISGGGMFGQAHGFGGSLGGSAFGGASRDNNDIYREIMRNRGGVQGGVQGHDAGKREFMFPSFLHQYPSASTPAPASGLLASLYGHQPGAFHDFGSRQKKKGKKHRHANTSSSGGSGLVDLADPHILHSRMSHQQSNAGLGQGLFGGQASGGYNQSTMYGAGAGAGFSRW